MYQQMSNNGTQLITFSCEVRELSFSTRKRYETCEGVPKIEIDCRGLQRSKLSIRYSENSLCQSQVVLDGFTWFKMVCLFLGGFR